MMNKMMGMGLGKMGNPGNPGIQKEAKLQALQEILQMLGDMEAEPFVPKNIKAMKVDIIAKKPGMEGMDAMEGGEGEGMNGEGMNGEMPEEENGLELEAKGQSLEDLKKKLAMLLG